MRRVFLLACSLFLAVDCRAVESFDCSAMPLMVNSSGKVELALYVPVEKFQKTPQWSPSLGEPALAMDALVGTVEKWAAAKYSDYERIVVDSISLRSYHCPDVIGRWYYVVEYFPVIAGDKKMDKYSMVAVLLDGSVIGLVPKK